jgi:hypothetical protein
MIKKGFLTIVISSTMLFSTASSAALIGGILCGLGVYCPPQTPPSPKRDVQDNYVIRNSPIGSLLPDYFTFREMTTFYNTMNYFFKMEVGSMMDWSTSGWGVGLGAKLTVLKVGTTSDNQFGCFQYKSEIRVYKDRNLIGMEDYTGAACSFNQVNRGINSLSLYIETDPNTIKWIN